MTAFSDILFYLGALSHEAAPFWVWLAIGALLLGVSLLFARRIKLSRRNIARRLGMSAAFIVILPAALSFFVGGYQFWYTHRPRPLSNEQALFTGITYVRDVRATPRSLVIHVVIVELDAPGLEFLVTPGESGRELPLTARMTSQFLSEFDLQLAVNGDFFEPWWSDGIFDYYPHGGDEVGVLGFASSRGAVYSRGRPNHPTLYLSADNEARFDAPDGDYFNAVSGNILFVQEGAVALDLLDHPYLTELHPRTALALDRDGKTLIIVVVDGRQPNYSEGMSIMELADVVLDYGGYTAINLDGGGSSTLVAEGESGKPVVLNSPIDQRIPGRERPVANHLGIFVRQ